MSSKSHFNVLIATPGNNFTAGYVKSLLKTIFMLNQEKISWNFLNSGGSFIPVVREQTIAGWDFDNPNLKEPCGGDFTYDKIFWIDSDIEWETKDFFKLYDSDKDIISGCYLVEDRHSPIYEKPRSPMMSEKTLLSKKDIFKVSGVGFGFLAIKQGVFEKMPRPWFGSVSVPNDDPNKKSDVESLLIGEDLAWSTKAIRCGFEIWVDPKVRVSHQKTFKLEWLNDKYYSDAEYVK